MKRILNAALFVLTLLICQDKILAHGLFFNIGPTATPANVRITLCLNAKGPLSCQHYNVSASNLSISTTIPNRTYPFAGIKIETPGYSLADTALNCTPLSNGFCMFSVSDASPVNINLAVDYIVVGVGTAGAVLAKTFSDGNQSSVVGLHNGPNYDQNPLITQSENAIITVLSALVGPPFYIDSATTPQINADGRELLWVYAIPLGGASAVNAGAWCRGTNQVFSQWAALAGPDWSVTNIQNTYVSLENYHGLTTNPAARGFSGLLSILQASPPSNVSLKFTNAIVNALGVQNVLDYNDPNTPIGASAQVQYTQSANAVLRASSSISFLNSNVMNFDGSGVNGRMLQVVFNATADNIIWQGNKAVGVRYVQNGNNFSLYAKKGVLVSAGIKSSAFLMRSGVGAKSLLDSLQIPVIFDNPNVGQGLADQTRVALIYTSNPADTSASTSQSLSNSIIAALQGTTVGQEWLNTIGTSVNLNTGLFAQMAWLPAPTGDQTVRKLRFATINPIPGFTLALFDLVQPQSRGSITLTSKDPFIEPDLDLGILSNSADLDLYVQGFQIYIAAINAQLQALDPTYAMIFPDPGLLDPANEAALRDFIQLTIGSDMHFQSHCRMAPLDQGGVVDSTGHVYGTQNLIVADDSIVPVGMDGSPMATAYLIAANVANINLG